MDYWHFITISLLICILVNAADEDEYGEVIEEGFYKKSHNVVIMTEKNVDRKLYDQKFAYIVQFYNSYCGDCRIFRSKFIRMATDIKYWKNILRLAVLDCSTEENVGVCRNFRVEVYPSIRYFHEGFVKGSRGLGYKLPSDTEERSIQEIKDLFIYKMQEEQNEGRLTFAPSLRISSYSTYRNALRELPKNVEYTFLVFESENSTVGSELALDMNDYIRIQIKRVYDDCELAKKAALAQNPAVVGVSSSGEIKVIKVKNATKQEFFKSINIFLRSKKYQIPVREFIENKTINEKNDTTALEYVDTVLYSDLEKTIRTSLYVEIARRFSFNDERLQAFKDYLDVLVTNYPFKNYGNLKKYLVQLRDKLYIKNDWTGEEIYKLVKELEALNAPVYTSTLEFVACKGSLPIYRGYSCGLWHLFHSLTVNAANQSGTEGPKVLRAMHGYIKNYFGCKGCADHFQTMAKDRGLFSVTDNKEAIGWLWLAHNTVNLRLSGDNVTDDNFYPKIQFPSIDRCPQCRHGRLNEWYLPGVFQYVLSMYGNIKDIDRSSTRDIVISSSRETNESPFYDLVYKILNIK